MHVKTTSFSSPGVKTRSSGLPGCRRITAGCPIVALPKHPFRVKQRSGFGGSWHQRLSAQAGWPEPVPGQQSPMEDPGPPVEHWWNVVCSRANSAIEGLSNAIYEMCPPTWSWQMVDRFVRAGLVLAFLAFAQYILSFALTVGIVGLLFYLISEGFGNKNNGGSDKGSQSSSQRPGPTWTVVEGRQSDSSQWKSAQSDLLEVYRDDFEDSRNQSRPQEGL